MNLKKILASLTFAVGLLVIGTAPSQATPTTFASGPTPALNFSTTLVGYPASGTEILKIRVMLEESVFVYAPVPTCTDPCPGTATVTRGGNTFPLTFTSIKKITGVNQYEFSLTNTLNSTAVMATPLQASDQISITLPVGAFNIPSSGGNYSPVIQFIQYDASGNSAYYGTPTVALTNVSPDTPVPPTVVSGDGQATATITPNSSGITPTQYRVTASPGSQYCDVISPATTCVISGLTNGTSYTFTAVASDANASSFASSASSAVTPIGTNSATDGTGLAQTGMKNSFLASGALGLSLIILGGVMVFARRMAKN